MATLVPDLIKDQAFSSASPKADVREALRLMVAHGYRHVPVVEGSRVIGIVAARDIYSSVVKGIQTGVSTLARQLLHG